MRRPRQTIQETLHRVILEQFLKGPFSSTGLVEQNESLPYRLPSALVAPGHSSDASLALRDRVKSENSQAQLMAADEGHEYVVKFKGNPQTTRGLANDYLAGLMHKAIGKETGFEMRKVS